MNRTKKYNTEKIDDIRAIYADLLLAHVFYILVCVCDNRIKDGMHKCLSPVLNYIIDGTVGALNTKIIYSVGFYGNTISPGGKSTIE